MPIPSSFADLNTNPNNNSPQGSEAVGPNANGYIQALSAFIAQIPSGTVPFTGPLSMSGKKITNLQAGTISSTSQDAVNGAQLQGVFRVGEVKMWHGAVANISAIWGPGWQLADGTNGTADLRDKFVAAAGLTYAVNTVSGQNSVALSVANMPTHNHTVNDSGHTHAISQTPHGHTLTDPGHTHGTPYNDGPFQAGSLAYSGSLNIARVASVNTALTGITLAAGLANVSNNASLTGITTANAGSGTAYDNRPVFYVLCFIEYTGIGA